MWKCRCDYCQKWLASDAIRDYTLRTGELFRSIEADVQRYIDAQRSELEALRRNGLVPRRGVAVASHEAGTTVTLRFVRRRES
jgi:hypothetical protein